MNLHTNFKSVQYERKISEKNMLTHIKTVKI